MTGRRRVPPGRAGRLRLLQQLHTAERGLDLLDRKLRILHAEQQRAHQAADRTAADWRAACAQAQTWLLRAALLGGQRGIRHAVTPAAQVQLTWTAVMGVRHPQEAVLRFADPERDAAAPASSALVTAGDAHRTALQAAARHAVAAETARRIDAEVTATRRRWRAVRDRWIPQLREALHHAELDLDELEHAEGLRVRWAARVGRGTDGDAERFPPS